MSNIKQCQNCQTEAQPGLGFCTNCGERLQEIPNCNSCGAQLQQGWKACPDCGNKVQAEQESSFDITDSTVLIRQTDESKTVDRSVSVGGDVSGTVNVGETVNVNNVVNVEPITVSRDEWETLAGKMNALVESAGTQTTQSAEPLTGKQSELASEGLRKQASKLSLTPEIQRHTDAWVRRKDGRNKVEETGQQVGPDTGDPETYRRLGDEASNSDDYEHAIENYSRAINLDDRNSTAYNNRAAAYIKMREYESAVQDFGKAIRLEPNDADLYSNRGAVHHTIGQYENAITNYGEAIRLKPSEANFYAFRALSYAALGYRWREGDKGGEQYELAIQDYVEAIRIVPNIATNPNILFDYVCMAKAYQQLKQFSQAKKIMDIAISRDPQEHYYYVTRASIYSAIGQPENALRDVEEAFRIDPELAKNEHAIAWYNTFKQSAASAVAELGNSSAIEFLAQNPTTSKYTSKWGWVKSNFFGKAAQRRQAMNPLNQLTIFKDMWGEIKEFRKIKDIDKSGKESNDQDSGGKPRE